MATVVKLQEYGTSIGVLFSDGSRILAHPTTGGLWKARSNGNGVTNIKEIGNQLAVVFTDGRHTLAYPTPGEVWYVAPHPDYAVPVYNVRWPFGPETWNLYVPGYEGDNFRTPERPSHNGMDMGFGIANITGTDIKSCGSGTVYEAGFSGSYGYRVTIEHDFASYLTRYAHMYTDPYVGVGDIVNMGSVLGGIGTTGGSTGNHLHFEVYDLILGDFIDPLIFMAEFNPDNLVVP